jgi:cell division protein FtsW
MINFSRSNTGLLAKWWRILDKQIFFCIIILLFFGLLVSFSSTSLIVSERLDQQSYYFFIKHLIFVLFSVFILFFISIQDIKIIKRFLTPTFLFLLFLLLLVPLVGAEVKGSKRWLDFVIFPRFQPIELLKPFFILLTAKILVLESNSNLYKRYAYSLLVLFSVIFLLINQPDIGQTLLIIFTYGVMIFISGINLIFLTTAFLVAVGFVISIVYLFPNKFGYILSRIQSFFDPNKGDSFQSQTALDAIKQGGLTGQGMGEGILKEKVPEAHTDYIIAVISEEFGTILIFLIIAAFIFIAIKVVNKVIETEDEFIKLSLMGLMSMLVFQALIHIGVNIRFLPTTGMTLPFLSYGGSSLLGSSLIAGMILNFTKKTNYN